MSNTLIVLISMAMMCVSIIVAIALFIMLIVAITKVVKSINEKMYKVAGAYFGAAVSLLICLGLDFLAIYAAYGLVDSLVK